MGAKKEMVQGTGAKGELSAMGDTSKMPQAGYSLHLMPLWELRDNGIRLHVCLREQRLLAVLAIHGPSKRDRVAGLLWPESCDRSAQDNLRVSIHHVTHSLPGMLTVDRHSVGISPTARVDLHRERAALEGFDGQGRTPRPRNEPLLMGWYEDWVLEEQAGLLQARTAYWHQVAARCLRHDDCRGAVEAAARVLRLDMLDEAALEIMVTAQLALGQSISAMGAIAAFRRTARHELGMSGSPALDRLEARVRGATNVSLAGFRGAPEPFNI